MAELQRDCQIWGILNVTPDSFSDGGRFFDPQAAYLHGCALWRDGATVIDVGGESSRPQGVTYGDGAASIDAREELARVKEVIGRLVAELGATVSIDTRKPEVAAAALALGARIVNDVSCAANMELLSVVAAEDAEYVLMHTRADGRITQENTHYRDLIGDIQAELERGVERCLKAGIGSDRIWLDPGIGFAKTAAQSVTVMANLRTLRTAGYRLLVGPSRKAFIAEVVRDANGERPAVDARLGGTLASVCEAYWAGADGIRVHDVQACRQAWRMLDAFRLAREVPTC